MTRKSHNEEGEKRFVAFAGKIANLSDDDWRRLSANCADLNSNSFGALIDRARLRARATSVTLPGVKLPPLAKAIHGIGSAVVSGMWFTYEVGREFDPKERLPAGGRKTASGDARIDDLVDGHLEIQRAIALRLEREPGTAAAVHAAGDALQRRRFMEASTFEAIYAFVEPVIPFASLTSQP